MKNDNVMTEHDIREVFNRQSQIRLEYPHQREGQAFFNALYQLFPTEADLVRGTIYDPYYKGNINMTIKYLMGEMSSNN